jgi:hypothetical protein
MKQSRSLVTVALGLGLTLALLWILRGSSGSALAQNGLTPVPPSLTRQHDPVVISGDLFSELTGSPLGEIFVYAYQGMTLTQIPFQIDERDGDGMYIPVEDNQLDDNDELVFMAIDGGGWVDNPSMDADGTSISPTYVITITDPISNTYAWAYVFRSGDLTYTAADYVSYDGGNDRITSSGRYAVGFNATYAFKDYLTMGSSSLDLLDRSKLRVTGTALGFIPFSFNEEVSTKDGVYVIDGPVRVTRVSTSSFDIGLIGPIQGSATLFAYRSLVVLPAAIPDPPIQIEITYLRSSTDWNEWASGMTYYDANNPAGVTIDGHDDTITTSPPTRWRQVTGVTGTVVSVDEIPTGLGGTQSTYYKDDNTVDPTLGTYAMLGHTYFLTDVTANAGAIYVDYYDNPLQVSVAAFVRQQYVYLPLVVRN